MKNYSQKSATRKHYRPGYKKNNQQKNNWRSKIVSGKKPNRPKPMATLMDASVIIRGNYTIITGKKKSRKSLLASMIMSKIKGKLLIIDTEQSKYHTWLLRMRVTKLKCDNSKVIVLNSRGESVKENTNMIISALKDEKNINAIMIDNIRDLLHDMNNPRESFEVVKILEQITKRFNVGILGVIHSNKSNGMIRGHLGSELENRAYMIIKAERSRNNESNISCESSRDGDFNAFKLQHNPDGMPEIIGDVPVEEKKHRLMELMGKRGFKRGELIELIRERLGSTSERLPERKAKEELNLALDKNWITKSGKERSRYVRYFFNVKLN